MEGVEAHTDWPSLRRNSTCEQAGDVLDSVLAQHLPPFPAMRAQSHGVLRSSAVSPQVCLSAARDVDVAQGRYRLRKDGHRARRGHGGPQEPARSVQSRRGRPKYSFSTLIKLTPWPEQVLHWSPAQKFCIWPPLAWPDLLLGGSSGGRPGACREKGVQAQHADK